MADVQTSFSLRQTHVSKQKSFSLSEACTQPKPLPRAENSPPHISTPSSSLPLPASDAPTTATAAGQVPDIAASRIETPPSSSSGSGPLSSPSAKPPPLSSLTDPNIGPAPGSPTSTAPVPAPLPKQRHLGTAHALAATKSRPEMASAKTIKMLPHPRAHGPSRSYYPPSHLSPSLPARKIPSLSTLPELPSASPSPAQTGAEDLPDGSFFSVPESPTLSSKENNPATMASSGKTSIESKTSSSHGSAAVPLAPKTSSAMNSSVSVASEAPHRRSNSGNLRLNQKITPTVYNHPTTAAMPYGPHHFPGRRSSADSNRPRSNSNISYNFTSARFAHDPIAAAARSRHTNHYRGSSLTAEEMSLGIDVSCSSISLSGSPVIQTSPNSFNTARARAFSNATVGSTCYISSTNPKHVMVAPPQSQTDFEEIARLRREWNQHEERKLRKGTVGQRIASSFTSSLNHVRSRCSLTGSQSDSPTSGRSRACSNTAASSTRYADQLHSTPFDWQVPANSEMAHRSRRVTNEWDEPAPEPTRRHRFFRGEPKPKPYQHRPIQYAYTEPRRKFKFSRAGIKRSWIHFITWLRTRLMRFRAEVKRRMGYATT